jgi:hypothetical protein
MGPRFLRLRTNWRWVVCFTPRPLYSRYPLHRRLGGPQNRCGRCGENSCPYRDSNSDLSVVQPVANRYTDCAIWYVLWMLKAWDCNLRMELKWRSDDNTTLFRRIWTLLRHTQAAPEIVKPWLDCKFHYDSVCTVISHCLCTLSSNKHQYGNKNLCYRMDFICKYSYSALQWASPKICISWGNVTKYHMTLHHKF